MHEVMSSPRLNENPHFSWFAVNLRGTSAGTTHCTYMAGIGESCSDIGALSFKLEGAVRAGFTKKACTDVACIVNQDFAKKIKPDKIANIKIFSQNAIDNSKKSEPKTISFSGTHTKLQNEYIVMFLSRFSKFEFKPVKCKQCKLNQNTVTLLFQSLNRIVITQSCTKNR